MSQKQAPSSTQAVTWLIILSEGFLLLFALGWIALRGLEMPLLLSLDALTYGVIATLLLCALSFFVLEAAALRSLFPVLDKFEQEVLLPLSSQMSNGTIVLAALLSGPCEELFFRSALEGELRNYLPPLISALLSAAVFALAHFLGALKTFWKMLIPYAIFGLYFSALLSLTGNLLTCMICHSLYNGIALHRFRARAAHQLNGA